MASNKYKKVSDDWKNYSGNYSTNWKSPAGQHYQRKKIETYLSFLRKDASIPPRDISILVWVVVMGLLR